MKLLVLSDIHANLSALKETLRDADSNYEYDAIAILGDIVNYGMRPNDVIELIKSLKYPIVANLFGNHEKALFDGDTSHFSTDRGREVLEFTRSRLNAESNDYLLNHLSQMGMKEMNVDGKLILFVHGSLTDPFWGKMTDEEMSEQIYAKYDYVISGHSHVPNFTERFYEDKSIPEYRNKKRTVFLNPGSVGQPRNHNPRAQYLFIDFDEEILHFNSARYNIDNEWVLYPQKIDPFYKNRLKKGI